MSFDASYKRRRVSVDEPASKASKPDITVEKKLSVVGAAVGNAHGRFLSCQVMLESMVPGALGPGLDERDELQDEGVQMIGKVMDGLLQEHKAALERKTAIATNPDGTKAIVQEEFADAQSGVDAAVGDEAEKDRGLKAARADLDAAEKALAKAKADQKKAEQDLKALIEQKKAYEDAYNMHFIPLRDGQFNATAEARKHLQALIPIFAKFDYEGSLIAAFPPAAMCYPDARRNFDKLTMEDAEKGFLSFRHKLEGEIAAADPLVSNAIALVAFGEDEVKTCKVKEYDAGLALGRSRFALAVAQLQLADAKKAVGEFPTTPKQAESMKVTAATTLEAFQTGPYEAYVYLRDRVAALAPYL
mmetsp:Transcript_28067/g.77531  ORF Transcript_28067/g.77531 Transcript_28067/m.77531 type:complete len:360 (+) Transcript_28067:85-1164(+)